ncbi:S-layer family protein [Leptolyngbya sp. FACHB-541]|uniref:beta strand repeat-containing protein n=1 Tax=Leptolyngbya sp. FACHB-541 TaxID=2692810 RepID=UPI0016853D42|nr:S-layer family protein [Leptolyngbya sp. FACHB-541]MBD1997192.1 S-layer family protein [Leptolyngbya sp. FACHB-541]
MFQRKWLQTWRLGLVSSITLVWVLTSSKHCAFAQSNLTPDTAPDRNLETQVESLTPLINQIRGGTQRGSILFHSFLEFNIPEDRSVYFENPSGITHILSRITGNDRSEILGTLGVGSPSALGTADLFLLNPNGILFGENAKLDTRGSFLASTADSLQFDDWEFSATDPQPIPTLVVNLPIGLQFGRAPQSIIHQAGRVADTNEAVDGLQVQPGEALVLVGGDVRLTSSVLIAPGGRIELGGLAEPGIVGLRFVNNHLRLIFPNGIAQSNVIINGSRMLLAGADGGSIEINARDLVIRASCLSTGQTYCISNGLNDNQLGNFRFNSTGAVEITSLSEVSTTGGDIDIQAESLTLDQSRLLTETRTEVDSGNVTVQTTDFVRVLNDNGFISATTFGSGNGGNISIETGRLSIRNGGRILTETLGDGDAGSLNVQATEVEVTGCIPANCSELSVRAEDGSVGDAGDLRIQTGRLIAEDGGIITTTTRGDGQAGELEVVADSIRLIGINGSSRSSLNSNAGPNGIGSAGRVTITTRELTVQDGAIVQVRTRGQGQGGFLDVQATDFILVEGTTGETRSTLSAKSTGAGEAGDVRITTGELIVRDGAEVTVEGDDLGAAGNLSISAGSVLLDEGALTAQTQAGSGANIVLQDLDILLMRDRSLISARALNDSSGGNITINADFIVAVPSENSDITANAFAGSGGEVSITSQSILGLAPRSRTELETLLETDDPTELDPQRLPSNDITAISQVNPALSGQVIITTPDVDPSQGTVELPDAPVTTEISQACGGGGDRATSRFISSGRGGLPTSPYEPLSGSNVLDDVQSPVQLAASPDDSRSSATDVPSSIAEAQGWRVDAQGEVVLVAEASSLAQESCLIR